MSVAAAVEPSDGEAVSPLLRPRLTDEQHSVTPAAGTRFQSFKAAAASKAENNMLLAHDPLPPSSKHAPRLLLPPLVWLQLLERLLLLPPLV